MRRTRLAACAALAFLALGPPAALGDDVTATKTTSDYVSTVTVTVTHTDPDPDHPDKNLPPKKVEGAWVTITSDFGKTIRLQTDKSGEAKYVAKAATVPAEADLNPKIVDCTPAAKDPHGTLSYSAATHTLSYTGGTISQVSYRDMTSTSVNTPTETIIGAGVSVTGMHLMGFDADGAPIFGNGQFKVSDALGNFLTATYENVALLPVGDGTDFLGGDLTGIAIDPSRTSRFLSELSADLAANLYKPGYDLGTLGELIAATADFTTNGAVDVADCTVNSGTILPVPEPGSVALLGLGGAALAVASRARRRPAPRHRRSSRSGAVSF